MQTPEEFVKQQLSKNEPTFDEIDLGIRMISARDAEWQARVDAFLEDNNRSEEQVKKQFANAVSFKARAEKAEAQVEKLDAEVRRLRAMLEPTLDARGIVIRAASIANDYIQDLGDQSRSSEILRRSVQKAILNSQELDSYIAAYRVRLLDEAAERGVQWLIEQTTHIDPALAATNSGKWLVKLREKQTASLRAAITKAEGEE